ncbi:MAG: MarR family transcriptional regulator [Solirubrobacteraceae bacterium]|nr:MarR family transcriptional regulator [Solirubrobacteraceae bacterium]
MPAAADRAAAIDEVAETLLPRASRLTRLLLRAGSRALTRGEAGLLATLTARPHRITELAETETLAQPTVTQLVDRLQRRGLVERSRDPGDGRVVLVSLTPRGRDALERLRAENRALLRRHVETLPDEDVAALLDATAVLGRLIDAVQAEGR